MKKFLAFTGSIFLILGMISVGFFSPNIIAKAAGTSATNTELQTDIPAEMVINALDMDGKLKTALTSNASTIAQATGQKVSDVTNKLDEVDFSEVRAVQLPSDAQESNQVSTSWHGTNVTITTYDSPEYVTANVDGQTVTFEVPENAQELVSQYLSLQN